jgi:putative intracellular protease/amidase
VLVAIPLFERFTALDAVGPYEVLQRVPSIDVVFLGHQRGEVRSDNGMLGMMVDKTFGELTQPDVVVFPGGIGTRVLINDAEVLDWVREAHEHSRFTTSVCTGGLVLAAAGLLAGLTATTHWRAQELFNSLGAQYVPQRVVEHLPQRIITAAGVSSGIDMALRLVELSPSQAGGAPGRTRRRRGQPVDDRVRPGASVRRRRPGQGRRGHQGARSGVLPPPILTRSVGGW